MFLFRTFCIPLSKFETGWIEHSNTILTPSSIHTLYVCPKSETLLVHARVFIHIQKLFSSSEKFLLTTCSYFLDLGRSKAENNR